MTADNKTIINNWTGGGTLQTWTDDEWQILYAKGSAGNAVTLSLTSQDAARLAYAVSPIPGEQFDRMRNVNQAVYELSYPEARADELRQIADEIECDGGCEGCGPQKQERGEFCGFVAADNLRKLASALDVKAKIDAALSPKIAAAETSPGDVAAMKEALKPFAKLAEWGDGKHLHFPQPGVSQEIDGMFVNRPDDRVILKLAPGCPTITLGDLRRARAAINAVSGIHATPSTAMNKQQIVDLIRENYDPVPSDWPRHRAWDDGAGDIADAILSEMQPVPSQDESRCPKCSLEAGSLLHRFCTHDKCPVRTAALDRLDVKAEAKSQEHAGVNRIWFDTEFIEDGTTIDLISIGLVRSDGATYYAETDQWIPGKASQWVKDNVIVHLRGGDAIKPRDVIAREIVEFAGEKPEFWAYYADYDWVALCQLYGTMMQLPEGWPMFCRDVKQLCVDIGNPKLPEQMTTEHHALTDAQWTKLAWEHCRALSTPNAPVEQREAIARALFESRQHRHPSGNIPQWEHQPDHIKQSFREDADAILDKARALTNAAKEKT